MTRQIYIILTVMPMWLSVVYAQETQSTSQPTTATQLPGGATIIYSLGDLEKMDKIELTRIYIAKLTRLYRILQYLPFAKLDPKSPNDLKVPSVQANEKSMKSLEDALRDYIKAVEASLSTITPYADKKQIIDAILFLQAVTNKVELVGLGMSQLIY
ncbi:MAG: hypothetical protein NZZ60_07645 [Bacteroidia bacterium]|nr:hypothetical protein [Bacteroidia bacterium]MCX7652663.1 hypothetical protein [Bacteroidia bacterium]MDW8416983.1 hypothetical protein [Bacteroidia bacterium]